MQRGVNKRWFFACALVLLIVGVVAYNSNPANPAVFGHSAGEVEVTVNGTVMTLQQAITQNLLGRDASNIIFIIPLELFSGTSAKAWTTYDLSSVVPIGTSALILESEFAVSGPNDGGATPAYVKMRKNSSSSVYLLARGQAWGAGDGVADSAQGFFPITTDRKIDYFIGPNGFDGQATIRIIGYVLGSSGGGTGGGTGTTGSGMLGNVPDAILCQAGESKLVLYAESVNTGSWSSPGRLVYSSFPDTSAAHQTMYFHPTTGAYIGTDNTSPAFSSAIASCTSKGNLSNQTGFKFAGVNNLTANGKPRAIVCNTEVQYLEVIDTLGTRYRAFDGSYTIFNADGSFSQNLMGANCPATALSTQTVLQ